MDTLDKVSDNKAYAIGGALFAFLFLVWLLRHLTRDS